LLLVNHDKYPKSKPLSKLQANEAVDELVVFQEAQTLPLFIVKPKNKGLVFFSFFSFSVP